MSQTPSTRSTPIASGTSLSRRCASRIRKASRTFELLIPPTRAANTVGMAERPSGAELSALYGRYARLGVYDAITSLGRVGER
jgi:hypothetical protein